MIDSCRGGGRVLWVGWMDCEGGGGGYHDLYFQFQDIILFLLNYMKHHNENCSISVVYPS